MAHGLRWGDAQLLPLFPSAARLTCPLPPRVKTCPAESQPTLNHISPQDEFYNRYVVKNKLMAPVVAAFLGGCEGDGRVPARTLNGAEASWVAGSAGSCLLAAPFRASVGAGDATGAPAERRGSAMRLVKPRSAP